jgi:hypothetical protein
MTNNAERELLPCPFCGGKAKIAPEDPELEGDGYTQVHCANAECSVDPSVECFEDGHKESAIRIWNTRAQASGVPDGYVLVPRVPTDAMRKANRTVIGFWVDWEDVLAATPTPPKSASVPVERLEALVGSWSLSALTYLDDSGDPYNICADQLAELIAEYK